MIVMPAAASIHSWMGVAMGKHFHNVFTKPSELGTMVGERHESMPSRIAKDTSGWLAWLESMRTAALLVFKAESIVPYMAKNKYYKLDHVAFLRNDYEFVSSKPITFYDKNSSERTYVGFGAEEHPGIPTIVLTDHSGLLVIQRMKVPATVDNEDKSPQKAMKDLEKLLDRPVQLLCRSC